MGILSRVIYWIFLTAFFVVCQAAEHDGVAWCGNKHKNLVILRDIVQGMPGVAVPEFLGISTDRVEKFLKEHNPLIFADYETVCDQLMRDGSPGRFSKMVARILPDELSQIPVIGKFFQSAHVKQQNMARAIQRLGRIRKNIIACFNEHTFTFTELEKQFFTRSAQNGTYFMVRSTGIEDSQTVANAGGNVSVAYVKPDVQDISRAMGEVVASYIGEQSMRNRHAGGESLALCLPVLIQELIGEQQGGAAQEVNVPISGVAFTTRASLSSPDFSLVEINAAYGHGEGVVANRVCTDCYYLTPSKTRSGNIMIYPAIRKKTERLIPDEQKPGLKMHKNGDSAMMRSVLNVQQLKHMYEVFKKIEQKYGQPMDIEFVVQGGIAQPNQMRSTFSLTSFQEKHVQESGLGYTLFIVQARPAMHYDMSPSYCMYDNIAPDCCTVGTGHTIVPGAAQALVVERALDIIIANTLDEADQRSNSATCKAVIVKEWASPLSHAAVNFTGRGIPCLCVQDIQMVARMLQRASSSQQVIIDPQRGCIIAAKMPRDTVQKYIMSGWFEHPAEKILSIFSDNPVCAAPYVTPIPQDGKLVTLLEEFKRSQDNHEQSRLLDQIVERISARCTLTEQRMKFINIVHDPLWKNFVSFQHVLQNIFSELRFALDRGADRFEVLFYYKMLEALVYQQNDRGNVVNGFTYTYFLNELFVRQHIYRIMEQRKGAVLFADELGYASCCPDPELAQHWIACVKELMRLGDNSEYDLKALRSLLADIHEMEGLSLWFATEFYRMVKSSSTKSPADIAQAMISYNEEEQQYGEIMQRLKRIKLLVSTLKESCAQPYATYTAVQAIWQQIDTEIISFVADEEMLCSIKCASSTIQWIACDFFAQIIDLIDTSMKTLKMSTAIALHNRMDQFKVMLKGFSRCCCTLMNAPYYIAKMRSILDDILERSDDESMFQRSNAFSVQAALYSSETTFKRHYPKTAEDMFMLVHQNSLSAIAQWNAQLLHDSLSGSILLPSELCEILAFIEEKAGAILREYDIGRPGRIGLNYTESGITVFYNMPLRNHSSTFQVVYDAAQQQCRIEVQFLGESRSRWKQVEILAELSEHLSGLRRDSSIVFDEPAGIVSWSWIITPALLPMVFKYLGTMGRLSLTYGDDDITLKTLRSLFKGPQKDALHVIRAAISEYERVHGINRYTLSIRCWAFLLQPFQSI